MIQDIGDHRLDNQYHVVTPHPEDYMLACRGLDVCVRLTGQKVEDNSGLVLGGALELPRLADFGKTPEELQLVYLLAVDGRPLFLTRAEGVEPPRGFAWQSIRELRMAEPRWLAFAAVTGHHLAGWYRANRYCGRCGHPTELVPTAREICCPACANVIYPRINPGVIVGVLDPAHERMIFTKYAAAHERYANYALVAGFTEIGETLEQTVRREVAEEVGLTVDRVRYWADQPWPFSASLLAGFWCEVQGSCDLTVDHSELKTALWLARDEVPMPRRDTSSLTNAMITAFAEGYDSYR